MSGHSCRGHGRSTAEIIGFILLTWGVMVIFYAFPMYVLSKVGVVLKRQKSRQSRKGKAYCNIKKSREMFKGYHS